MVLQRANDHAVHFGTQRLNGVHDQIMSQGTRSRNVLDPSIDARGLEDPDHDRELPLTIDFFQPNHLLLIDFTDDDSGKFDRD